jgi:aminopeptidase N
MRTEPSADPYVPGHGDLRYAVEEYDLDLDYTIAGNHLAGRTVAHCRTLEATEEIAFDLSSALRVMSVEVTGATVKRHAHRGSRLALRFDRPVPAGHRLTVTIATKGHPRPMRGPDGLAGWEELEDGVIVASQPHGAPSWFACNDRPSDKAAYRVTIACDAAYTVWGNGRLAARRKVGRKTAWTWVQSEPMAPYLATLQIGRYAARDLAAGPVPVRVVGPPRLRAAMDSRLRRPGADDRGDAGVVRAVSLRGGLHRGRHGRRPRDPPGEPDPVDLRRQPDESDLGGPAPDRP